LRVETVRSPLRLSFSSRRDLVTPLGLILLAACGGGEGIVLPNEGEPAAIEVLDGDGQQGRVGEPLTDSLVVQVTDSRGRPVEGATVAFEFGLAGAGAAVIPQEKTTNRDGLAAAQLVLGTSIGQQAGQARVVLEGGRDPIQAPFTAMALPENANSMAAVAGQDQSGHVGLPLDDRLVVEVVDGFGNPVAGVPISWTAVGGGSVSEALVETDEDGRSRVDRTLGPTVGPQSTVASADRLAGSPVTFAHTALPGDAARLIVISGNDQIGEAGTTLPADLVVQLIDPNGNGIPHTAVTWVVATGGGAPTPETSTTDADGRTSARWTLGSLLGQQRLDAVVSGIGVATFHATAVAVAPPSLVIRTQPAAAARNGVPLTRQPVIQLRDSRGSDVAQAGVLVSAAIGSGGGELGGTRQVSTDASGQATFTNLSIAGAPGPRTLIFTATGYAQATSSAIDLVAVGTTTTITADTPDPSAAGSTFSVQVRVASEGATPTGTVTVTVSGGTPTCTATLSSGVASCPLTLNIVGDRTLTATYSGAPGFSASADTEAHTVTATSPANEAPDADYNWHCEGLTCQFTDASEDDDGSVVSWSWNFDGTGTSNLQNPSHTFPGPGEYEVTLTVRDNGGAIDESSAGVEVEAPPPPNQPPTAEFTWQCDELDCEFEDESSDGDGDIEDHAWTFGDGATSDDDDPDHTYSVGGTYQVTLSVTDDDEATNSVTHAVTVSGPPPNQAPAAAFTFQCDDLECEFEDQSTDNDGRIEDHDWTFGDGHESDDDDPDHRYSAAGTYQVTLTVTDNDDAESSVTRSVTVTAPPPPNQDPTADFSSESCTAGQPCQFNDASSDDDGSIASRAWEFEDGTPPSSTGQNPSVTFASEGSKTVRLTVTDDDGARDTEEKQVNVSAAPSVNQAPTPQNDAYATLGGGASLTVSAPGVLTNDSDPDGDELSAQNASDPALGSVSLNSDGSFTYTPDSGATGPDSFTYDASDGSLTTEATVTITISP
jgi:PKD repeat protein